MRALRVQARNGQDDPEREPKSCRGWFKESDGKGLGHFTGFLALRLQLGWQQEAWLSGGTAHGNGLVDTARSNDSAEPIDLPVCQGTDRDLLVRGM